MCIECGKLVDAALDADDALDDDDAQLGRFQLRCCCRLIWLDMLLELDNRALDNWHKPLCLLCHRRSIKVNHSPPCRSLRSHTVYCTLTQFTTLFTLTCCIWLVSKPVCRHSGHEWSDRGLQGDGPLSNAIKRYLPSLQTRHVKGREVNARGAGNDQRHTVCRREAQVSVRVIK